MIKVNEKNCTGCKACEAVCPQKCITVTENTIVAEQSVNPNVLGKISEAHDKPGADMLHEVTEAYQGALISQKKGVSSPASNQRARYIAVLTIERQNNPELYLRRFMTLPEKKGKCSQEEDIRQEPLVRNGSSKIRRAKKTVIQNY